MPLDGWLLDPTEVAEQAIEVWNEPARLLAADLLERISTRMRTSSSESPMVFEELLQPSTVGQHEANYLLGPAQGVGMAALEHVGERLGHAASLAGPVRTPQAGPQAVRTTFPRTCLVSTARWAWLACSSG